VPPIVIADDRVVAAAGAIVVTVVMVATFLLRGRPSHPMLPSVSEQWFAQHKGERNR
jgi:hypothetical protein